MPLPSPNDLLPLLSCLSSVPQNPLYHGEGDVLTHTRMVVDELSAMPYFITLDEQHRGTLSASAMLHDIGKQACTKLEAGCWTSPHHGSVGAHRARELLIEQFNFCGTPDELEQREAICALIQWHMRPIHILDAANPERTIRSMAAYGELSRYFSLELLATLSEADCLGRVCSDACDLLEAVRLFSEFAIQQNCYYTPFHYPDSYSRFADLSGRNVVAGQSLYNSCWGTITMLSGLPGTGKDTWIKQNLLDQPMLSLDDIREELNILPTDNQGLVVQTAMERGREYLRRKQIFTYNATNLTSMLRGKWISLFHKYGATVRIVYLETKWDKRTRRNINRDNAVPEGVVSHMLSRIELPTLTEAEEVAWICV